MKDVGKTAQGQEQPAHGGAAFPRHIHIEGEDAARAAEAYGEIESGMSLRDYFAAHFMERAQSLSESDGGWDYDNAAQCAYSMADAMLKEREKS